MNQLGPCWFRWAEPLIIRYPHLYVLYRVQKSPTTKNVAWASWIQSIPPRSSYLRFVLILSHLRQSLSYDFTLQVNPQRTEYPLIISPARTVCPAHLTHLDLIALIIINSNNTINRHSWWREQWSSLFILLYPVTALFGLRLLLNILLFEIIHQRLLILRLFNDAQLHRL
jgi:uncharacterized membrane protein